MPNRYPAEHPLRSACLKVHRAGQHIRALQRSLDRQFKVQYEFKHEVHETYGPLRTVRIVPQIDAILMKERWAVLIGDVVSNLRAALDHIAWALATTYAEQRGQALTEVQQREVHFPIVAEAEHPPACRHLPPAARPVILKFQPYNAEEWHQVGLLGILNDLANVDKHRIVHILAIVASIYFGGAGLGARFPGSGEFTFGVPVETDGRKMTEWMQPSVTFDLCVYRGDLEEDMTLAMLREAHRFTKDEVIPAFAEFVPKPS